MADDDKIDELDELASEYVLGTLPAGRRIEVERRLELEPDLARAVGAWQSRLEPLLDHVRPVAPPDNHVSQVLDAIARDSKPAQPGNVIQLQNRLNAWRRRTIVGGSLAAALALFVVLRELGPLSPARPGSNYIAVLQSQDNNPQFVASVDLARGTIDLLRLAPEPARDKSYELWAVGGNHARPLSLGLVNADGALPVTLLRGDDTSALRKTTLAISLEPAGGSPTGQPTGPVLFTGRIVPSPAKQ